MIALLGHTDTPVDGVEDYCTYLSRALERFDARMEVVRVSWFDIGWFAAMRRLARESASWQRRWVVLQFTALAWSRHGFPFGVLAVLAILRNRGVRCAVVFHEPDRHGGSRWIDRLRGICQDWVIRKSYRDAELAIFPILCRQSHGCPQVTRRLYSFPSAQICLIARRSPRQPLRLRPSSFFV